MILRCEGALFGKSTIAGAISAISAKPTDEFEASLKVGTELEYGGYTVSGHVSGALSDSVRARLAVKVSDLDGYTENIALDKEDGDHEINAVRLSFDWDAGDDTSIYFKFETGESNTDGRNNQLVAPGLVSRGTHDPNQEYESDKKRPPLDSAIVSISFFVLGSRSPHLAQAFLSFTLFLKSV